MSERKIPAGVLRAVAPVVIGLTAIAVGAINGVGTGLLVLAGGTLLLTISLFWASIQDLSGEGDFTLDEALSMAAPSAEEERKRSVLRALKDLEYERSVGKIADDDYAELSGRYRREAKALLQSLDQNQTALRERAEAGLARRLKQRGMAAEKSRRDAADKATRDAKRKAADAAPASGSKPVAPGAATASGPTRRCGGCDQRNDLDAQFCKRCGEPLADDDEVLCSACPAVYEATLDACPDCGVPRPVVEATAEDDADDDDDDDDDDTDLEGGGEDDDADDDDTERDREAT